MALKTFVKVSKVNNLSDARYCAGMGVNIIGFNLVPGTPNFVTPEQFSEITEWLSGVDFAGEFEGLPVDEILRLTKEHQLQYIQVQDPSLLSGLAEQELPLILKIDMDQGIDFSTLSADLQEHKDKIAYVLFESPQEAYEPAVLEKILTLATEYPVLLGYGITPANISDVLNTHPIKGVALFGEEEIRVGYKDFEKLAEMLELLEADEFEE